MRRLLLFLCIPLFVLQIAHAQSGISKSSPAKYRQWINGQELGGVEERLEEKDGVQIHTVREWLELSRLGLSLRQEAETRTIRKPDGHLECAWRLRMAQDPLEGEARFDPAFPRVLRLQPKGGAARELAVPEGALLWAPDFDARLGMAAAKGEGLTATRFSAPTQEWSTLELRHQGLSALPGHPKAVRLSGWERSGKTSVPVELWVDPEAGLLKERSRMGALEVLIQAADLPAPGDIRPGDDLFARTLKPLPPHAFLPWLPELELRQTGGELLAVMEDAQCRSQGKGRWHLSRAVPPSAAEAAQKPVKGEPDAGEAPFLRSSPLLQYGDPLFDGLIRRLAPRPGATRWELAQAVTRFVFEWITEKDYSVGFASALEVARRPKGDCTEHGVLAVALLRKLGVPARAAVGWVALDRTLGPHFWVEVRLKDRWIPVDPTLDQAPASAFRLKLSDSDLADLGGVGWEAAQVVGDCELAPVWTVPTIEGDHLRAPDGLQMRWPGGQWRWVEGALALRTAHGRFEVKATIRPIPAQLQDARLLQAPGGMKGWWTSSRTLFAELPAGRWLQVEGLTEATAFDFLQTLQISGH